MSDKLSPLQEEEKKAMVLDRVAILRVVGALREYRKATRELLSKRYRDGECDAVSLHEFEYIIEEIELDGEERED